MKYGLAIMAAIAVAGMVLHAQAAETDMPLTNLHKTLASQTGWLNTERAITAEDLKGRIILLDFWTYCCINCMHVIPDLKYLEEKFGDDLTVIGVHSAKFKNERDTDNIKSAILRYGIHHAVVNDFDFSIWKKFGVRAWPTFMLINPDGTIEETYSGEGNRKEVEEDIEELREQYAGKFVTTKLPIALEETKTPASVLSFPSKLAYGENILYASDSGHHRIVVLDPNSGAMRETIGSGKEGFKDGSFEEAQFRRPQGILFSAPYLYIADTENHALRRANLSKKTVETIAGTGKQGYDRKVFNEDATEQKLASPWDLAFYPDENHIVIAMAGTHQLWSYDIAKKTVSVIAGNGRESIDDGKYPYNSLSQPSGLSVHDGKLYFVDSETSSLRVFADGKITTLIGTGLFDFGYKEGKQGEALMQHALGVFADDTGVYVADSYNHSLRRYDPETGILSNFAGHGKRGNHDGAATKAEFNEPNDILKIGDSFYIADTNNNTIRIIKNGKLSTLPIGKAETKTGPVFSTNLPNLETLEPMEVAASATVSLVLKKGWHINEDAPSTLGLFDNNAAVPVLLSDIPFKDIRKQHFALPGLETGKSYWLQGTLYYCEDKEGAQCLIKSFDIPLNVTASGEKEIRLKLN